MTHQDSVPIILAHKQQLTRSTLLAFQSLKGPHANTYGLMQQVHLKQFTEFYILVHVQKTG